MDAAPLEGMPMCGSADQMGKVISPHIVGARLAAVLRKMAVHFALRRPGYQRVANKNGLFKFFIIMDLDSCG